MHRIPFNVFENKTIVLENNNTKYLFVQPGFVKTRMQIIHTLYYIALDEGAPKAPFSIAITSRCRGGHYSISWIAPHYPYSTEC